MLAKYCQEKTSCAKPQCLKERTAFIYCIYDPRLCDILYVGSTFYPGPRFAQHLSGACNPYNTKSLWLQDILESGSYPLPFLLSEFQTMCDNYTRDIEGQIAAQLRAEGYTAICDGVGSPVLAKNFMQKYYPDGLYDWRITYPIRMGLWAEYTDRNSEQARVTRMLREMYLYG